jgi:hypothetical protein
MGYKSKNLSRTRRLASSAKADTQADLHKAISNIGEASRGIKSLNEKVAKNAASDRDIQVIGHYAKIKDDDKDLKRTEYSEYKNKYNMAIDSGDYDHPSNFFPEFDDWYQNRTSASLGGSLMSASKLKQGAFDVNSLNIMMQLWELENGKK